MGKRPLLSSDEEKLINKLILEGHKPSDIRDYFKQHVKPISISLINNYKADLKKKLKAGTVPVTYGTRNTESKKLAMASITAVTGQNPKLGILHMNSVKIDVKKAQFFINDIPVIFNGTPKGIIFNEDTLVIQYKKHSLKVHLKN